MAEYIDRKLAFFGLMRDGCKASNIAVLMSVPVADVVPVVRCKNCIYWKPEGHRCDHPMLDFDVECFSHWIEMEPNGFCSCGERMADNG